MVGRAGKGVNDGVFETVTGTVESHRPAAA